MAHPRFLKNCNIHSLIYGHKTRKILDYTLTEHFIEQYIENCSVKQENTFNSDHRIVLTELTTPMTKKARYKKKVRREKPINIKALRNLDIQNQFTTSTKGFFKPCHKNSLMIYLRT